MGFGSTGNSKGRREEHDVSQPGQAVHNPRLPAAVVLLDPCGHVAGHARDINRVTTPDLQGVPGRLSSFLQSCRDNASPFRTRTFLPHLVEQIRPIDAGLENLSPLDAQDGLDVLADLRGKPRIGNAR